MNDSASQLAYLRDPRISAQAIAAAPAWLWSADATRILWANAVGAAVFHADTSTALAERHFDPQDPAAQQIVRIAAALPLDGVPRLERLTGLATDGAHTLACGCSRVTLHDGGAAIFVVAAEAAGPSLALEERVQGLVAGFDVPIAVFSADGILFHANQAAAGQLAVDATLETFGADALATHALRAGYASGASKIGAIAFERIGNDAATFLIATLPGKARAVAQPPVFAQPISHGQETAEPAADVFADVQDATHTPPANMPERRQPMRFVWKMDTESHFTVESDDFVRLTGPRTTEALGRRWNEIVSLLGVDIKGQVLQAVASRDTWSGIVIDWPVDGTNETLAVELSGLPVFDRERNFSGYRGFGVCRDARRISIAPALRYQPAEPPKTSPEKPAVEERPMLNIVPQSENVVPFRAAALEKTPSLSPGERSAFHELAKELTSRLQNGAGKIAAEREDEAQREATTPASEAPAESRVVGFLTPRDTAEPPRAAANDLLQSFRDDRTILDRLPTGVLVYRLDTPLYGNPAFLEWSGYDSITALTIAGGLDVLFVELGEKSANEREGQPLRVTSNRGSQRAAEGRLFNAPWDGDTAHVLMLMPAAAPAKSAAPSNAALEASELEARELKTILDTASDGVLVLDRDGRILTANGSAEKLFGRDAGALIPANLDDLIAPESQLAALEYLTEITREGSAPKKGCEVIGRGRDGTLLPLFMTLGRLGDGKRLCAVFRDLTSWKKTEMELVTARRQAEQASSAKSEFLAKVSHEIRTPLNSIIGFSEVMMDERFGPIANERYKQYLKDIHQSGGHLVSLLNDLLDLSKIEAGKLDLSFGRVSLNELTQQCVSLMQPQANQERVIIRTSLPNVMPAVMADARSVRQIVLNLLSNSIKFTGAGGQVIISTTHTDDGEVVLRVRDTGHGMTEKEIEMALEPFRQLATSSRWGSGGTGLGLPLTKALAEANRAHFSIKSAVNAGTLVEISFPPARVLVA
jgi:PAS domain S-box-containing protein